MRLTRHLTCHTPNTSVNSSRTDLKARSSLSCPSKRVFSRTPMCYSGHVFGTARPSSNGQLIDQGPRCTITHNWVMSKKTRVPGDHGGRSVRRRVAWNLGGCVDCFHVVVFWIDSVDYHVLSRCDYLSPLALLLTSDGGLRPHARVITRWASVR
jgi:hypothetical protein